MKGIVINPVKPLKLQRTSTHKANLIGALCIEFNNIRKKRGCGWLPNPNQGLNIGNVIWYSRTDG